MSRFEVIIVGAGPAGLAAAIQLGRLGIKDVLIADRHDFPRDKTCGSALSPKGIKTLHRLDLQEEVAAHALWINGMRLVTPSGHDVQMVGKSDAAMICNRRVFDGIMLRRAQALGITFGPHMQVEHLLTRDDRVVGIQAGTESVRARFTVVADGAKSRFALDRGPRRALQTIMGWWDNFPHDPGMIDMIFDPLVAPLYGWMFPETPTRVNIGICYEDPSLEKNGREIFQKFLDKYYADRLSQATQVGSWKGHPISYSTDVGRLTSAGRFVIGEAGRMTHPATGEGIYQAMNSGIEAANAIAAVLSGRKEEADAARDYEAACRSAYSASFRSGMVWRKFIQAGGLDVTARAAKLPFVQRRLAGTMAHM